jgi:hypothetical protein
MDGRRSERGRTEASAAASVNSDRDRYLYFMPFFRTLAELPVDVRAARGSRYRRPILTGRSRRYVNGGDVMNALSHKPLWLTIPCTRCEDPVIVLIRPWSDSSTAVASWTCPHCGGLQELPIAGEVVLAERAAGVRRSA